MNVRKGLPVSRTVAELRATVSEWRRAGATIAVVPTMGALHDGHLSLVRTALSQADRVIATLFVNPTQFNDAGDLAAYPRTEWDDAAKLAAVGTHLLYAPDVSVMYPPGFSTTVRVGTSGAGLCDASRPGHFDGVATVVTKLLIQSGADLALFGEKDFQQLHIIRRLARDLDIPVAIVGHPTVRESDGLALSSRNARLSAVQRRIAPHLARILVAAAEDIMSGAGIETVLGAGKTDLLTAGFERVDYLEYRAADDLTPLTRRENRAGRLLAAAWLGETRLIDNVSVAPLNPGAAGPLPAA